jgi:hypothetical protein
MSLVNLTRRIVSDLRGMGGKTVAFAGGGGHRFQDGHFWCRSDMRDAVAHQSAFFDRAGRS